MRSLPLMLAVLIALTGLTLGAYVMFRQAPATSVGDGAEPAMRGGKPQGHVYAGITEEPDDVNPLTAHGNAARRFVIEFTHEGLLDTDPDTGELRAALATAWELAPDHLSCTFTLRDGVQFADGAPMTMADVLFGWELARAGQLQLGFVQDAYARVAAAEVLDERHLKLTFKAPHYAVLRAVGERWIVVQRQFFVDRVAALAQRLGEPAPAVDSARFAALLAQIQGVCGPGTGPYQLPAAGDESPTWRRRQDLTLVPNARCWRRAAFPGTWNLAGVRLLFREPSAAFPALMQREVDWLGTWSVDAIVDKYPALLTDYEKLVYDYDTLGVMTFVWNCRRQPLTDVRVRCALTMLVDQGALLARFGDAVTAATAFAKPRSPGYPRDILPFEHSVSGARQLLREAGFVPEDGKPLRLQILSTPDGGPMDLARDLFEHAAKDAGIELTVQALDFPSYVAAKKREEWDGLLANRSFRPWDDPFDFVHSQGADNDGHFANAEVDRLAELAQRELDPAARALVLQELHRLVYKEQAFTFLVHPKACLLFNRHIQDAKPGPRGLRLERWWVPKEFQRK